MRQRTVSEIVTKSRDLNAKSVHVRDLLFLS